MKLYNLPQVNFYNVLIIMTLILRVLKLNKKLCFLKTSSIASFLFSEYSLIFNSRPFLEFTK